VSGKRILFDSRKQEYKEPFGCLRPGEHCRLRVEVPFSCPVDSLTLRIGREDGPTAEFPFARTGERKDYAVFGTEFALEDPGLYFYDFRFRTPGSDFTLFRLGAGDTNMEAGERWQLSVLPADYRVPDALRGAVTYQIFPDRFCRVGAPDLKDKLGPYTVHEHEDDIPEWAPDAQGCVTCSDFYGGNFQGIRERIPYLASLGTETIYLNPVCMAYSNHRYDTADYLRPDPMLGTAEDFTALCAEAHARGMRVILDGVFSHTGSDSRYFDALGRFGGGAASDPASPYRSWYRFSHWPDEYESWWGIRTLPCVEELAPDYMAFILDRVLPYWLGLGADGFRLDVADELPDAFLAALRRRVKELKPEALVLGEVWEDASNKWSYGVRRRYFTGGELDAVTNYPYRRAILDYVRGTLSAPALADTVLALAENYPPAALDASFLSLSTHDTPRILTLLGDDFDGPKAEQARRRLSPELREKARRRLRAAAVLQFTLPGSPCIYYGDEAGMEGFGDPFNRGFFPWGREDGELTELFRRLAMLKKASSALRQGDIAFSGADGDAICFMRRVGALRVMVAVSRAEAVLPLPESGYRILLLEGGRMETERLHLEPFGAAVLEL